MTRTSYLLSNCVLGGLLWTGFGAQAHAADYANLSVVKPVENCSQLATADLRHAADGAVKITSATVLNTEKGAYCKVVGVVDPLIAFETDLPIDHWTQRFAESAMGRGTIGNAGACSPAINGELVVAADHMAIPSTGQTDVRWTSDMDLRINYAYRGNHEAALVSKALIKIFYGQAAKFSYFVGCSEGGRESLEEAQRYPDDFDGIAAGAPVAIDNVHNSFYHPWENAVNRRADGSRVLAADRLSILHDAVLAHCGSVSGMIDNMLQIPMACTFNPAWVQCPTGTSDTTKCLTPEETAVVAKLYAGPGDPQGDHFEISGFPLGSEMQWKLSTAAKFGDRETNEGFALRRLLPLPEGGESTAVLDKALAYTQAWYNKLLPAAPLYNAANTDLRPFQSHGGKLILWQGAEDTTVQPAITVAYYEGVQKEMGVKATDSFMRYFLLPGVGHCGGGEGAAQIDVLSPLMAWTELHQSPAMIVAGKVISPQRHGGGFGAPVPPYSTPNRAVSYTRPIYPFPAVAQYNGHGDPNNAASYHTAQLKLTTPLKFNTEAASLIGPDNQKTYMVANGNLVPVKN